MIAPVFTKFENMNINESMDKLAESMINVYTQVSCI